MALVVLHLTRQKLVIKLVRLFTFEEAPHLEFSENSPTKVEEAVSFYSNILEGFALIYVLFAFGLVFLPSLWRMNQMIVNDSSATAIEAAIFPCLF